jgi:serine/threonine protein kinase, bacterial
VTTKLVIQAGTEPYPGFRLLQLRGSGGYGEVWEAETHTGSHVALKFMPCNDNLTAAQEVRAIQQLSGISHKHLIRIDKVWCQPGYVVLAMELADGSLTDLLEAYITEFGTSVAPAQVCQYLHQAAQAIDFLNTRHHHSGGRLVSFRHGDVKPSNILIVGDTIKLADFGLATALSPMTRGLRPCGTPVYAAPELFQGRASDRTDQFALAVSYYQLRTGRFPHPIPDRFRPGYQHPTPDLHRVTPGERDALLRALATKPIDRWPSCVEMMDVLSRQVGAPCSTATATPATKPTYWDGTP